MGTIALVQKDTNRHGDIVRELTSMGVERVSVFSLEAFMNQSERLDADGILLDRGESLGTFFQIVQRVGDGPPIPIVLLMERRDEQGKDCLTGIMLQPFCDLRFPSLLKEAVFHIRDFCTVCEENQRLKNEIFERKIIERAKWVLVRKENLSEDRAYRRIRAESMKRRWSMKEVALDILSRSDEGIEEGFAEEKPTGGPVLPSGGRVEIHK